MCPLSAIKHLLVANGYFREQHRRYPTLSGIQRYEKADVEGLNPLGCRSLP